MSIYVFNKALKYCRNPFLIYKKLKAMLDGYDLTFYENVGMSKVFKSNGRYFFRLNVPGWPSKAYDNFIDDELSTLFSKSPKAFRLQFIVLGITKSCPLRCEHCYEWERLNQPEESSLADLKEIVNKFRKRGVSQILISGGEPMSSLNNLLDLLSSTEKDTDFWLLTSGFNITTENARKLKEAGLTGVNISLDHWKPEEHNTFRGHPSAYEWATRAAANVRNADMLLCFSLCATPRFVSSENLWEYARLAQKMGASFIQILEARSVGHFKGKDVQLTAGQEKIIEEFHMQINSDPAFRNMPAVMYGGFHQRRIGCLGGGKRFLYVDTNGFIHACPFCQHEIGHCLSDPLEDSILKLQKTGCHKFNSVTDPVLWK